MAGKYRVHLGVLLGLLGSVAVLSVFDGFGGTAPATVAGGPLLSDCDGEIRELVIHYVAEAAPIVEATYGEFLHQLPADVTVHVVCPDRSAVDDLIARIGPTDCVLSPVIVDHPITPWSRDRWLTLAPAAPGEATLLLCPRDEMGAEVWPARRGDRRVGGDLAATLGPRLVCRHSELFFDGGDFVADDRTVFVTPDVLRRNLQQTVATREELLERLSAELQRDVVLLRDAPDHHAGMFMMAVGDRTVLVGDPASASRILAESDAVAPDRLCPSAGPDFSEATQAQFDAVAEQCLAAGYRVVRIPVVPGGDRRTYVTYLNVILDRRDGRRIVYMPTFSGADPLNDAARDIWAALNYDVRTVDCTDCYPHFGSLRCLVNVIRRG